MPPPPLPADEYQVSHLGLVRGAFRFDLIEAMILAGFLPKGVDIRKKNSGSWEPTPPVGVAPGSVSFAASSPLRQKSVTATIGVFGAVGLLLAALLATMGITRFFELQKQSKSIAATSASATPTPPPLRVASTPATTASSASRAYSTPISLPASTPASFSSVYTPTNLRTPSSTSLNGSFPPSNKRAPASSTSHSANYSTYVDASGQTYRVSDYDYRRLQLMKAGIQADETFVEKQQADLEKMERDISVARQNVNRHSQASVNRFNTRIANYNNQLENAQASVDRFNRKVDEFNAELKRVGTPIR
jgi:hypothetical protein